MAFGFEELWLQTMGLDLVSNILSFGLATIPVVFYYLWLQKKSFWIPITYVQWIIKFVSGKDNPCLQYIVPYWYKDAIS